MRMIFEKRYLALFCVLALAFGTMLSGCSDDDPLGPTADNTTEPIPFDIDSPFDEAIAKGITVIMQDGRTPPADQVTYEASGRMVTSWPYTGTRLDGTPSDPISLVLTGDVDILGIREALLALDGNRTAFGFPDAYPFNQPWDDCLGGSAQVTWEEDAGWTGGVVQLTVGNYEPLRVHLRLFRVDDTLTLGAAHFEVLIPGTSDHQVLSWELAEQMVAADLLRAGLLAPGTAPGSTGPITDYPSFRSIPAMIYNSLPAELAAIVGPAQPVTEDVPLPNDGAAIVLALAGLPEPTQGFHTLTHTAVFDQYIPRPFCSSGPYDWLYVMGEVQFTAEVGVDSIGRYRMNSSYAGVLWATPVNPATGEQMGETFTADVEGRQDAVMSDYGSRLIALDRKLTNDAPGVQINQTFLQVVERDRAVFRGFDRCFEGEIAP